MGALLLSLIYLAFISLGLPDSLVGSAWPIMHAEMGVPVAFAGVLSTIISLATILSSLFCDRLTRKFGAGMITAVSTALTAVALLGYSCSDQFWMLIIWSIPYGLGAGAVDAVLNNYVALHYKPQHMSWLHCFWGVGASISPYIMSFSLLNIGDWNAGFFLVFAIQMLLSVVLFVNLPLWKRGTNKGATLEDEEKMQAMAPLSFTEILKIPGALPCFLLFFCYCSLEVCAALWASSYLVDVHNITPETASAFASLFYIGITLGRAINGFLAMKFQDKTLIWAGMSVITVGIVLLMTPISVVALAGFVVMGLGCAPIYPCIIHMTPDLFGKERSQGVLGVQMAAAYLGFCIVPPIVGWIADGFGIFLLPVCLAVFLLVSIWMHAVVIKSVKKRTI